VLIYSAAAEIMGGKKAKGTLNKAIEKMKKNGG